MKVLVKTIKNENTRSRQIPVDEIVWCFSKTQGKIKRIRAKNSKNPIIRGVGSVPYWEEDPRLSRKEALEIGDEEDFIISLRYDEVLSEKDLKDVFKNQTKIPNFFADMGSQSEKLKIIFRKVFGEFYFENGYLVVNGKQHVCGAIDDGYSLTKDETYY